MSTFREIFENHSGNLINKWEHYFDIYERYLSQYKGKDINILEIGISHGGSLQLWKKYFGSKANIFAIDVNPECKKFEEENINIFIGSQSDAQFLEAVAKQLPPLDIIIDDGGHTMLQQITSFEVLTKYVKADGVYICEDTHTSYWYEYRGGLGKKGTFIEYCKGLIDHLNAYHIKDSKKVKIDEITNSINSIHFYDSVVVFEKRSKKEKPFTITKGNPSINLFEEPEIRRRNKYIKSLLTLMKKLTK